MPHSPLLNAFLLLFAATAGGLSAFEGAILEDHSGEALVSARVRVRDPTGGVVADRDSDRAGRFRTPPLDPGLYRVEVSKPNYLPAWLEVAIPADLVRIRLARLGVISGRVLDAARRPIRRAFVFPLIRIADRWRPLQAVATDASGAYRLHGLAPGRYAVGMSRSSYQHRAEVGAGAALYPSASEPTVFEITSGEEQRNIDFVVPAGAGSAVAGRVEGADAEKAFAVGLARRDHPLLGVSAVKTDEEGRFEMAEVPPGSYSLFASGPVHGYGWREAIVGEEPLYGRTEIVVSGQDLSDLTLTVEPARTATLLLEYDAPKAARFCPATATVRLIDLAASGTMTGESVRLRVGEPRLMDRLAPISYAVVADGLPNGCFQSRETVFDARNDSEPVVVSLSAAARIEGRLIGDPTSQSYFVAIAPERQRSADEALRAIRPDASGRFFFDGLRPGAYRIMIRPDADERAHWLLSADNAFSVEAFGGTATQIDLPAPKSEEF